MMSIDKKIELLFQTDELGRIIVDKSLIDQITGAGAGDENHFGQDPNTACGNGACHDNATCADASC